MDERYMIRTAIISDDGRYRYRLYREWAPLVQSPILWVMLNPSTADANIDDPTIRRCIEFSKRWGYTGMFVGNLYAYRSSDPKALRGLSDHEARGPRLYSHLYAMAAQSAKTVCAWGNHGTANAEVIYDINGTGGLWCLGITSRGQPTHPLARGKSHVPYDRPLQQFQVRP